MKPLLALAFAGLAATCSADKYAYPNDTFVIPNLITTTYTTNRRTGQRSNHMWFTLGDNSYHWEPQNATCDVTWRITEPAPSGPIACKLGAHFMTFEILNFTDIKDFNLHVRRTIGSNCPACCNSSDQFLPWAAEGYANITRDGLKWRRTRTSSGSTVSAVADEPVLMPIEYMNMCDGHVDEDNTDDESG